MLIPRKRLLIGSAVAAALLLPVAADRIAAEVIEHRLASRLRCAAALPSAPEVDLGGFPALTQLAARRLSSIRVRASDVALPKFTVARLDARASRVTIGGGGVSAASVTVAATVPFGALPLGVGDLRVVGSDEARRLVAQGTVSFRGITLPATVHADLALSGNQLTVTPAEIELSSLGLRVPASRLPAAKSRSIALPALPGGLAYRSITAAPDGLEVVAGGTDLRLADSGRASGTCEGGSE